MGGRQHRSSRTQSLPSHSAPQRAQPQQDFGYNTPNRDHLTRETTSLSILDLAALECGDEESIHIRIADAPDWQRDPDDDVVRLHDDRDKANTSSFDEPLFQSEHFIVSDMASDQDVCLHIQPDGVAKGDHWFDKAKDKYSDADDAKSLLGDVQTIHAAVKGSTEAEEAEQALSSDFAKAPDMPKCAKDLSAVTQDASSVADRVSEGADSFVKSLGLPALADIFAGASVFKKFWDARSLGKTQKLFAGAVVNSLAKSPPDEQLVQAEQYAAKKVRRKYYTTLMEGFLAAVSLLGKVLAAVSGPAGATFAAAVEVIKASVSILEQTYNKVNAFIKWCRGHLGKQRKESADTIVTSAINGDADSLALLSDLKLDALKVDVDNHDEDASYLSAKLDKAHVLQGEELKLRLLVDTGFRATVKKSLADKMKST